MKVSKVPPNEIRLSVLGFSLCNHRPDMVIFPSYVLIVEAPTFPSSKTCFDFGQADDAVVTATEFEVVSNYSGNRCYVQQISVSADCRFV